MTAIIPPLALTPGLASGAGGVKWQSGCGIAWSFHHVIGHWHWQILTMSVPTVLLICGPVCKLPDGLIELNVIMANDIQGQHYAIPYMYVQA